MITNNPPKQLPKGQEKEFAKAVWQEVNGYLPSDEELDEILINHGNDYRGIVKEILIGATDENADIALEQFLKKKGLQSGSISTKSFTESGFAQPGQQEIFSGDIESGIAKSPKESAASVAGQLAASLNFAKRQAVYNLKSVPKDVNNMFLSGDFEYSPLDVKGVYDRFNESVKTSSDIVKSEYENILKSFNTEIETKKSRVKEFDNFVKSTAEEYSNYIAEWLKANPDRVHGILSEVGDGNINEDELNRKVFEAAERHLETSSDGTYIQLRNKYQNVLRERELRVAELNSVFSKVKSEYDKAVKKMPGRVYDSAMSSAFGEAYALFKDINKDGKITEQIDKIVKYSKTNPEIADNLLGALNLNIAAELNKRNKLTPDIAKKFHDILYITTNLYDGLVDSDGMPSKLGMLGIVDRAIALARSVKDKYEKSWQNSISISDYINKHPTRLGGGSKEADAYLYASSLEDSARNLREEILKNWDDKGTLYKIWEGMKDAGLPVFGPLYDIKKSADYTKSVAVFSKLGLTDMLRSMANLNNIEAVIEAKKMDSDAYRWSNMAMQSVNFMTEIALTGLSLSSPIPGDEAVVSSAAAARGAKILNNIISSGRRFLKGAVIDIAGTAFSPSTYNFIMERLKPEIIDDGKTIRIKEKDFTEAVLKGFYESYTERLSERIGGLFDPLTKAFGDVAGRRIFNLLKSKQFDKAASEFNSFLPGAKKFFGTINDFAKRIGINNPFAEVAEEYFAFLIQNPVLGEQPWYYGILKENENGGLEFDLKTFKDILVTTGIISSLPVAAKGIAASGDAVKKFALRVVDREDGPKLIIYNDVGDVNEIRLTNEARSILDKIFAGEEFSLDKAKISPDEFLMISLLGRIIEKKPDIVEKKKVGRNYEFLIKSPDIINHGIKAGEDDEGEGVSFVENEPVAQEQAPEETVAQEKAQKKPVAQEQAQEEVVRIPEDEMPSATAIINIAKDLGINIKDSDAIFYIGANQDRFVYDFISHIGRFYPEIIDVYKEFLNKIVNISEDKTRTLDSKKAAFNEVRQEFIEKVNSVFDDIAIVDAEGKLFVNPEYINLIEENGFEIFSVPVVESGLSINIVSVKDPVNQIGVYRAKHYTIGEKIYEAKNDKEVQALVLIDYYKNKNLNEAERKFVKDRMLSFIGSDIIGDNIKQKLQDAYNDIDGVKTEDEGGKAESNEVAPVGGDDISIADEIFSLFEQDYNLEDEVSDAGDKNERDIESSGQGKPSVDDVDSVAQSKPEESNTAPGKQEAEPDKETDKDEEAKNTEDEEAKNTEDEEAKQKKISEIPKIIGPNAVGKIFDLIYKKKSVAGLINDSNAFQSFLSILIDDGLLMPQGIDEYFNSGNNKPTDSGRNLLENILLGAVLEPDVIKYLYFERMGNIRRRVIENSFLMFKNQSLGANGLRSHFSNAIMLAYEAISKNTQIPVVFFTDNIFSQGVPKYGPADLAIALLYDGRGLKDFLYEYNSKIGTTDTTGTEYTKEYFIEKILEENLEDYERYKESIWGRNNIAAQTNESVFAGDKSGEIRQATKDELESGKSKFKIFGVFNGVLNKDLVWGKNAVGYYQGSGLIKYSTYSNKPLQNAVILKNTEDNTFAIVSFEEFLLIFNQDAANALDRIEKLDYKDKDGDVVKAKDKQTVIWSYLPAEIKKGIVLEAILSKKYFRFSGSAKSPISIDTQNLFKDTVFDRISTMSDRDFNNARSSASRRIGKSIPPSKPPMQMFVMEGNRVNLNFIEELEKSDIDTNDKDKVFDLLDEVLLDVYGINVKDRSSLLNTINWHNALNVVGSEDYRQKVARDTVDYEDEPFKKLKKSPNLKKTPDYTPEDVAIENVLDTEDSEADVEEPHKKKPKARKRKTKGNKKKTDKRKSGGDVKDFGPDVLSKEDIDELGGIDDFNGFPDDGFDIEDDEDIAFFVGKLPHVSSEDEALLGKVIKRLKRKFPYAKILHTKEQLLRALGRSGYAKIIHSGGRILGAYIGNNTIYISPAAMRASVAIHEFAHLFIAIDPKFTRRAIDILKKSRFAFRRYEFLRSVEPYANMSEDRVWKEVLAEAIAEKGVKYVSYSFWDQFIYLIKDLVSKIADALGLKSLSINERLDIVLRDSLRKMGVSSFPYPTFLSNKTVNGSTGFSFADIEFSIENENSGSYIEPDDSADDDAYFREIGYVPYKELPQWAKDIIDAKVLPGRDESNGIAFKSGILGKLSQYYNPSDFIKEAFTQNEILDILSKKQISSFSDIDARTAKEIKRRLIGEQDSLPERQKLRDKILGGLIEEYNSFISKFKTLESNTKETAGYITIFDGLEPLRGGIVDFESVENKSTADRLLQSIWLAYSGDILKLSLRQAGLNDEQISVIKDVLNYRGLIDETTRNKILANGVSIAEAVNRFIESGQENFDAEISVLSDLTGLSRRVANYNSEVTMAPMDSSSRREIEMFASIIKKAESAGAKSLDDVLLFIYKGIASKVSNPEQKILSVSRIIADAYIYYVNNYETKLNNVNFGDIIKTIENATYLKHAQTSGEHQQPDVKVSVGPDSGGMVRDVRQSTGEGESGGGDDGRTQTDDGDSVSGRPGGSGGIQRGSGGDGDTRSTYAGGGDVNIQQGGANTDREGGRVAAEEAETGSVGRNIGLAASALTRIQLEKNNQNTGSNLGDADAIKKEVLSLTPEQAIDVSKVENALYVDNRKAVVIANPTGSGKTLTSLAVARRILYRNPDAKILVVAPSQSILSNYISENETFGLNMPMTRYSNKSGLKTGVNLITYAGLTTNTEIAEESPDLVIFDESESILQNISGTETKRLSLIRKLLRHPDFVEAQISAEDAQKISDIRRAISALKKQYEEALKSDKQQAILIQAQIATLNKRLLNTEREAEFNARQKIASETTRIKAVFMSATAIPYHTSIEYLEGFVFNLPKTPGMSREEAISRFLEDRFGIAIENGKLKVVRPSSDIENLERGFLQELMDYGVVVSRPNILDVDYSRHFYRIPDSVGVSTIGFPLTLVDDFIDAIKKEFDKAGLGGIGRAIIRATYTYKEWVALLETYKFEALVPMILDFKEQGKNVVLFHNYNVGSRINFADFDKAKVLRIAKKHASEAFAILDEVISRPEYAPLVAYEPRPIAEIAKRYFPDILIYNGTVSDRQKLENKEKFQKETGQIILVQKDSKSGINLHDKIGNAQRVTIFLGMPVSANDMTQSEGRTLRYGSKTDAVYIYPVTGANIEYILMARGAQRAAAAENLSQGGNARALNRTLMSGLLNPETVIENPGKGGKEKDEMKAKMSLMQMAVLDMKDGIGGGIRFDGVMVPHAPVNAAIARFVGATPGHKVLEINGGGAAIRFMEYGIKHVVADTMEGEASVGRMASMSVNKIYNSIDSLSGTYKYNTAILYSDGGAGFLTKLEAAKNIVVPGNGRVIIHIPKSQFSKVVSYSENNPETAITGALAIPTELSGFNEEGIILSLEVFRTKRRAKDIKSKFYVEGLPLVDDTVAREHVKNGGNISDTTEVLNNALFVSIIGESDDSAGEDVPDIRIMKQNIIDEQDESTLWQIDIKRVNGNIIYQLQLNTSSKVVPMRLKLLVQKYGADIVEVSDNIYRINFYTKHDFEKFLYLEKVSLRFGTIKSGSGYYNQMLYDERIEDSDAVQLMLKISETIEKIYNNNKHIKRELISSAFADIEKDVVQAVKIFDGIVNASDIIKEAIRAIDSASAEYQVKKFSKTKTGKLINKVSLSKEGLDAVAKAISNITGSKVYTTTNKEVLEISLFVWINAYEVIKNNLFTASGVRRLCDELLNMYLKKKSDEGINITDDKKYFINDIIQDKVISLINNYYSFSVYFSGAFFLDNNAILINEDHFDVSTIFHEFIHSVFFSTPISKWAVISALTQKNKDKFITTLKEIQSRYSGYPDYILLEEVATFILTKKYYNEFLDNLAPKPLSKRIAASILSKFGLSEDLSSKSAVEVINAIGRSLPSGKIERDYISPDAEADNVAAAYAYLNKLLRLYNKAKAMLSHGTPHDKILNETGWAVDDGVLKPSHVILSGLSYEDSDYSVFDAEGLDKNFRNVVKDVLDALPSGQDGGSDRIVKFSRNDFIPSRLRNSISDNFYRRLNKIAESVSGDAGDFPKGSPANNLFSNAKEGRKTYSRLFGAAMEGNIPNIDLSKYKNFIYDVKNIAGHEQMAKDIFAYFANEIFGVNKKDISVADVDKAKEFLAVLREFLKSGSIKDVDASSLEIIKDIIKVIAVKFIYGKIIGGIDANKIKGGDRLFFENFAAELYDELSFRQTQRGQEVKIIGEAVKDIINDDIVGMVRQLSSKINDIIERLASYIVSKEYIEGMVGAIMDSLVELVTAAVKEVIGDTKGENEIRGDIEKILSGASSIEQAFANIKDYIKDIVGDSKAATEVLNNIFDNFRNNIANLIKDSLKSRGIKADGIEGKITDILSSGISDIVDNIMGIVGEYAAGAFFGRLRRMANKMQKILGEYMAAEERFVSDMSPANYNNLLSKRLAIERLSSDIKALILNYNSPAYIKYIDLIRPSLFTIVSTATSLLNNMLMSVIRAAELMVFIVSSYFGAQSKAELLKQAGLFSIDTKAAGFYFHSIPSVLKSVLTGNIGSGGVSEKTNIDIGLERKSASPLLHLMIAKDRFEDLVKHWSRVDTKDKLLEVYKILNSVLVSSISVIPALMSRPLQASDEIFKHWYRLNIMSALAAKNGVPYHEVILKKTKEYRTAERIAERMLYQQENIVTNALEWLSKNTKKRLFEALEEKSKSSSGFVEKALTGEGRTVISAWISYGVVEFFKMVAVAFARFPINYVMEIIHLTIPAFSLSGMAFHITMYRNARKKSDKDFHRYMVSSYAVKLTLSFAGMAIAMKLLEDGLMGGDDEDDDVSLGQSIALDILRATENPAAEYLGDGELKIGEHRVSLMSIWSPYVSTFIWGKIISKMNKRRAEEGLEPYTSTDILPSIARDFFGIAAFYDSKGFNTLFDIIMSNTFFQQWSNYYNLFTMQEGAGAKTIADFIYFSLAPLQPRITISAQKYLLRDEIDAQKILRKPTFAEEVVSRLSNNVPFLRKEYIKNLPDRFNIWGEKIKRAEPGESDFYAYFIDPVKYRRVSPETVDEWKYTIAAVYEKYKDARLLPPVLNRSFLVGLEPYQKAIIFNEYNYIFGNYFKRYFLNNYNANYRGRYDKIISDPMLADMFADDVSNAYFSALIATENLLTNLYFFNFVNTK